MLAIISILVDNFVRMLEGRLCMLSLCIMLMLMVSQCCICHSSDRIAVRYVSPDIIGYLMVQDKQVHSKQEDEDDAADACRALLEMQAAMLAAVTMVVAEATLAVGALAGLAEEALGGAARHVAAAAEAVPGGGAEASDIRPSHT